MKNQIYNFPDSKYLVVCGDIHGDFNQLLSENTIDVVITHSAPSFCELKSKLESNGWIVDDDLYQDIKNERAVMDKLYEKLKGTSVTHWCYGHFHQSWHSSIDGILFKMLDIMELFEVRQ